MDNIKKDKILIYISVVIIIILSIIFGYFLIDLNNKQKKIDELNIKCEEIKDSYKEIHNKVENVLNENL